MNRRRFLATMAALTPALIASTATLSFGSFLDDLTDVLPGEVSSVFKGGKKILSGFDDITPEQEHYLGRSVAAVILSRYPYSKHRSSQKYVNLLGQSLAQVSDRPETFGGYHFLALDTDEINALSAPGGFIFVTKGLIRCCRTEDAMAAVLAHEIGHVQRQHGLQSIQESRITDGVTTLAIVGTSTMAGGTLRELTNTFDDSIKDITTAMIDSGYSRSFEEEADTDAVTIMKRIGYDPNAIIDMLNQMQVLLKPDSKGFAKTHPSPQERIDTVLETLGSYQRPNPPQIRATRLASMTKGL